MNPSATNTIDFTRTFHPIGQGAFYSEIFNIQTDKEKHSTGYRVVYDCGSKKNKDWLKKRIAGSYPTDDVDIFFLSHFHDDHYKGLENLQPRIIILPLLNEWDKVIFWIGRQLRKCTIDIDYASELKVRFPNSRFVYIRPLDEESRQPEEPTDIDVRIESNYRYPQASATDIELPSGTPVTASAIPDWIYIPINPKLDKSVTDKFRDLLKDKGIDETELKNLNKDFFLSHKKDLSEIYRKIGNPNEFSMVVYSGPNPYIPQGRQRQIKLSRYHTGYIYCNCTCHEPTDIWYCHDCPNFIRNHRHRYRLLSGCLYLGDINLSDKHKVGTPLLQKIYRMLPMESIHNIGTIQVPHHGSIDNYNSLLMSYYDWPVGKWEEWDRDIIYVISAGESNGYGHPSAWVMKDLLDNNRTIVLVTEYNTSVFIEKARWK